MYRLLILLLCLPLLAEEPKPEPVPAVEALQAENAALRAELAEMQIRIRYDQQVCQMPDLMQARLAVLAAREKAKAPATSAQNRPK